MFTNYHIRYGWKHYQNLKKITKFSEFCLSIDLHRNREALSTSGSRNKNTWNSRKRSRRESLVFLRYSRRKISNGNSTVQAAAATQDNTSTWHVNNMARAMPRQWQSARATIKSSCERYDTFHNKRIKHTYSTRR